MQYLKEKTVIELVRLALESIEAERNGEMTANELIELLKEINLVIKDSPNTPAMHRAICSIGSDPFL